MGITIIIIIIIQEFLKISVDLQLAFAAETQVAEGQCLEEQVKMLKLTNDPGGNPKADCFEDREAIFSATKNKAPM